MKILIMQPKLENKIDQLESELVNNPEVDIVIFPEGYLNENIQQACTLAKNYNKILIGGHRRLNERPKDRAIIIDRSGQIILDRVKYSQTEFVYVEGIKIGHILCDELVIQGVKADDRSNIDLIVHPIGVGMFSEEQFDEWLDLAKVIAVKYKTTVIGTSHADGTFRDSNVSIPIAYSINKSGNPVFVSKNDVRPHVIDFKDCC